MQEVCWGDGEGRGASKQWQNEGAAARGRESLRTDTERTA